MTLPHVAIVMPVVNGETGVRAALDSCLRQDYSGPLDVVVAVGPSTDRTPEIVAEIVDDRLRVIDNPTGTTPDGLRAAIAATAATVVARCDAHSLLPPSYVTTAVEALDQTDAAVVGGVQQPVGQTDFERGVALAMQSRLGAGGARYRTGGEAGPVETVYLGVYRRSDLEAVGGFGASWLRSQDYELNHRLRKSGATVWFEPALVVAYRPRGSVRALWRQFHDYGRWKRALARVDRSTLGPRQVAAPALLVGGAVAAVATPWFGWWPLASIAGAYALVLAIGTAAAAPSRGWAWFPVAAATMHLAWGSGFLRGGVGPGRR